MDTGFITLHRKITENCLWQKPLLAHLTVHLLLMANHEEKKTVFAGNEVTIKRGQLITGRYSLAEQTGLNVNTIKDLLKTLVNTHFITIKTTNKFSLITIVKYSDYQDKKERNTSKNTNQTPARHQQDTTNNNVNNDNNVNKEAVAALKNLFFSNPLLATIKQKYPDRDYEFYFYEMCDWWMVNKRKLPKALSAFSKWLSNTKPDPELQAERRRKLDREEQERRQKELIETPRADQARIDALKNQIKSIGKPI